MTTLSNVLLEDSAADLRRRVDAMRSGSMVPYFVTEILLDAGENYFQGPILQRNVLDDGTIHRCIAVPAASETDAMLHAASCVRHTSHTTIIDSREATPQELGQLREFVQQNPPAIWAFL